MQKGVVLSFWVERLVVEHLEVVSSMVRARARVRKLLHVEAWKKGGDVPSS